MEEFKFGNTREKIIHNLRRDTIAINASCGKLVFKGGEWEGFVGCITKLEDLIQARLQGNVYYEGTVEQNVYLDEKRKRCLTIGKSISHVYFCLRSYEKEGKLRINRIVLTTKSAGGLKRIAFKISRRIDKCKFEKKLKKYRKSIRSTEKIIYGANKEVDMLSGTKEKSSQVHIEDTI